jgi:hypothetical protein
MADMFDEVDAAIQRDKAIQWWQKNGNAVVGVMLAIVVGVGINGWWQNHQSKILEQQTAQLLDVLLPVQGEAVKPEQAEATLKNLQASGDKQLDVISALQLASHYEADGKNAEAAAILKPLMTRRYTEKILQDLATVQYVRLQLADKASNTDELLKLVEPLTASNRPFRYTAKELQALILQQSGKTKDAQDVFKSLSDDQSAPATLRERAQAYVVTAESTH